jgi:hypothetical protein
MITYYLLLFLGATMGLTNIIVRSRILKPFREFLSKKSDLLMHMVGCHMCIGFWSGLFVYLLMSTEFYSLCYLLLGSYVCWVFDKVYMKFLS